jgi:hypothetical protein
MNRQHAETLNNIDALDFQDFGDDSYGINNISTISRPNDIGSGL